MNLTAKPLPFIRACSSPAAFGVFTALIALLIMPLAKGDDVLPKRADFSQYQAMLARSPFAVATAPAAPAAAPDFARDLYVANAAHSPDGDLVTIASTTDRNFKKYLTTKAPVDGFTLSGVDWSDKIGQTKVTITKDGKYATLTFNQALLAQPAAIGQQPMNPMMPNQGQFGINPPQNYIKPAPIPSLPPAVPIVPTAPQSTQNRLHTRGVIQRNPVVAPTPLPTPEPIPADSDE